MSAFKKTERNLDALFHKRLSDPMFSSWFLGKTKFAKVRAELLDLPWQFRWYQSKASKVQSETDIFLVYKEIESESRFALHVENKLANGKFGSNQPALYHERARDWMSTHNYQDYEVVLIAPRAFYEKFRADAEIFHCYISHEEISIFIPEFS